MKLKFMLVPLAIFGLAVGSYADCSKDEIMKLIDKGFTKTEINGICGKNGSKKEKSKWISPTKKNCNNNGGKMNTYTCKSSWSNAKKICSASGGRLATFDELKKVVIDCGGIIKDKNNNETNAVYQNCYKEKGFSSFDYWSSTTASNINYALGVYFYNAHISNYYKLDNRNVNCVRIGQ